MFPFYEQFQLNLGVVSRDILATCLHFLSALAIEFRREQRKRLISNVVNCRKRRSRRQRNARRYYECEYVMNIYAWINYLLLCIIIFRLLFNNNRAWSSIHFVPTDVIFIVKRIFLMTVSFVVAYLKVILLSFVSPMILSFFFNFSATKILNNQFDLKKGYKWKQSRVK